MRKQLLEYDDVANDQRKVIYQQRNDIMDAKSLQEQIAALREGCFTDLVRQHVPPESVEEQWDLEGLERVLAEQWQISLPLRQQLADETAVTDEDIVERVVQAGHAAFAAKVEQIGPENFTQFERMVLLQSIDSHWREHLSALDYLRQGIHLRGYAQKQPKQEYKREAFELFAQLLDSVKNEVTRTLMTVQVQSREQLDEAASQMEQREPSKVTYSAPDETGQPQVTEEDAAKLQSFLEGQSVPRVGRNDPCPCGSGKKYKQCHGRLN
jgi:preprotein translocase subunit SecA